MAWNGFFATLGRKSLPETALDQIKVAKPCIASWEAMAGDDRVRHCEQCQLNVYNLSAISRIEAQTLLREHAGRICVRLYRRRDGTVITQDCPRGVRKAVTFAVRFVGAALSAIMAVSPGIAQQHVEQGAPPPLGPNHQNKLFTLTIMVLDPQGAVISGAGVRIISAGRIIANNATDKNGQLTYKLSPGNYSLEVAARGFKTQTRKVEGTPGSLMQPVFKMAIDTRHMVSIEVGEVRMALVDSAHSQVTNDLTAQPATVPPGSFLRGRPSPLRN